MRKIYLPCLLLVTCACAGHDKKMDADPVLRTKHDIIQIVAACEKYLYLAVDYPSTMRQLTQGPDLHTKDWKPLLPPEMLKDAWGTPYRLEHRGLIKDAEKGAGIKIISAGPDKVFNTKDDISYPDDMQKPTDEYMIINKADYSGDDAQ